MNTENLKNFPSKPKKTLTGKERLLFIEPNSAKTGTIPPANYIQVEDLFNINFEQILAADYTDDADAEKGNIPVGGIYHNNGELRIRLK